jgi:hypothetical protein
MTQVHKAIKRLRTAAWLTASGFLLSLVALFLFWYAPPVSPVSQNVAIDFGGGLSWDCVTILKTADPTKVQVLLPSGQPLGPYDASSIVSIGPASC